MNILFTCLGLTCFSSAGIWSHAELRNEEWYEWLNQLTLFELEANASPRPPEPPTSGLG